MTTDHQPPVVFGVAMAVILTPLVVFIPYLIRAATIARHRVSVGPFNPRKNGTPTDYYSEGPLLESG